MQARDTVDVIGTAVNLCANRMFTVSWMVKFSGIQAGFRQGLDGTALV